MTTKICTKCGVEKLVNEFGKESRKKDGLTTQCKECRRKYRRAYRKYRYSTDPEYRKKVKERSRLWYQEKGRKYYSSDKKRLCEKKYKSSERGRMKRLLSDFYIKNAIVKQSKGVLSLDEVPKELIAAKRKALQLKRLIKSKRND